ncbi:DDE-type integrase/transposase/recombinase [Deinococcus oregonensis]|uniref:DDE-type integrase/transposase/recombinase n=1 Tax=Deinococcus oregonensis TaxID=1805970 RepID=A0ABV6AVD3_9DEIO
MNEGRNQRFLRPIQGGAWISCPTSWLQVNLGRVLNFVDDFTRERVLMHVGTSITGADVARLLTAVLAERAQPAMIVTDNGPEFICKVLDQWAHERGIIQQFNRPGKPVENAYIEREGSRVRDECLNLHWFQTLSHAR